MREETGVALSALTTLRIGGPARRLVVAETAEEVVSVVREADAAGEPLLVMGGGSNLVVADVGFDGTVLQIATHGAAPAPLAEHALVLEAGVDWDHAVELAVREGYAGVEALSGIPGLVGATPVQNIGAYGQDVSQTIAWVRALDRTTGDVVLLDTAACGFAEAEPIEVPSARAPAPRSVVNFLIMTGGADGGRAAENHFSAHSPKCELASRRTVRAFSARTRRRGAER